MVHAQAVQRHAGILFLGDFWHVRGSLRVDLLTVNTNLLDSLAHWTQLCIMIPGNHDQVTADNRSLTPLQHAYCVTLPPSAVSSNGKIGSTRPDTLLPGIVIFSQPTFFAKPILQSPLAQDQGHFLPRGLGWWIHE
jgi:hypothetical protein